MITRNESAKKTLNKIALKIGYKTEQLGVPKGISERHRQLFNVQHTLTSLLPLYLKWT